MNSSSSSTNTASENLIPKIKQINIFMVVITLILMIMTILALFYPSVFTNTNGLPQVNTQIITVVMIILFFLLIIFILMISFIPSLKNIKEFIGQMKNVFFVILYTIFIIIFFRTVPRESLNSYANIVTPVTIIFASFLFYKAFSTNYLNEYNINYERIKSIILFFCFITLMIIYYTIDPGQIISKYFGVSSILTILLAIFSFLYIIILFTMTDKTNTPQNQGENSLISNLSKFSVYGGITFIVYLLIVIFGVFYFLKQHPNTFEQNTTTNNKTTQNTMPSSFIDFSLISPSTEGWKFNIPLSTTYINNPESNISSNVFNEGFGMPSDNLESQNINPKNDSQALTMAIVFILLTCIIFSSALVLNVFPEAVNKTEQVDKITLLKKVLLVLVGLTISSIIISLIVITIQNLSGQSSIISFLLNMLVVIIILALIYKTIHAEFPKGNAKKQEFVNLVINIIFYIPCLFFSLIEPLVSLYTGEIDSSTYTSLLLIVLAIVLLIAYFKLPQVENKITLQGGQQLVNKPVNISNLSSLANNEELNGDDKNKYEYGLSFWFFIDAMPPNTNQSYNTYTSIINYGNKPNVSCNATENSLIVTMDKTSIKTNNKNVTITADDINEGIQIIYEKKGILLQKWNNMIINYTGGTIDIFLNNELVKSVGGVVPYMTMEPLTIGSENGIIGGVCNVVYFKKPLSSTNMYYLYNSVKDRTPPTTNSSNETIISLSK